MGKHINETPKGTCLWGKTSYDVYIIKIDLPVRPVHVTKRPKRQRKKPNRGKLGIRRDHPRREIEMKFCVVGGL